MAIGYDSTTDTILIVGGRNYPRQFVEFKDHQFTDVYTDWTEKHYLTVLQQTYGSSQHFTQRGNDLWMIRYDGFYLLKMNTKTREVSDALISIPITNYVSYGGCLTASTGFLIVIGGGVSRPLNKVQIYNLGTSQWLSGVPSVSKARTRAACVAINDKVYAIGGISEESGAGLDSIEALDVAALPTTSGLSWNTLPGKLSSGREGPRAAVYGTDIYVIGGYTGEVYADDVNVIDTLSGNCEVVDTLAFPTSYAASIIVGNVMYSFGGYSGSSTNKYQYSNLPTAHPTKEPTKSPTQDPTAPTEEPTADPSEGPTRNPSETPTEPTRNPSEAPTEPTKSPTEEPAPDSSEAATSSKQLSAETIGIIIAASSVGLMVIVAVIVFLFLRWSKRQRDLHEN
eukprot:523123_1